MPNVQFLASQEVDFMLDILTEQIARNQLSIDRCSINILFLHDLQFHVSLFNMHIQEDLFTIINANVSFIYANGDRTDSSNFVACCYAIPTLLRYYETNRVHATPDGSPSHPQLDAAEMLSMLLEYAKNHVLDRVGDFVCENTYDVYVLIALMHLARWCMYTDHPKTENVLRACIYSFGEVQSTRLLLETPNTERLSYDLVEEYADMLHLTNSFPLCLSTEEYEEERTYSSKLVPRGVQPTQGKYEAVWRTELGVVGYATAAKCLGAYDPDSPIRVLGRGAFGCVYLLENEHKNELRAIKFQDTKGDETVMMRLVRERNIMMMLAPGSRPFILQAYSAFILNAYAVMDIEYAEFGDMHRFTSELVRRQATPFTKEQTYAFVASFLSSVIPAVSYLHSKNVVHCDLKLNNIVVCSGYRIKIADFGLAENAASPPDYKFAKYRDATEVMPNFMKRQCTYAPEMYMDMRGGCWTTDGGRDGKVSPFGIDVWGVGNMVCALHAVLHNENFETPYAFVDYMKIWDDMMLGKMGLTRALMKMSVIKKVCTPSRKKPDGTYAVTFRDPMTEDTLSDHIVFMYPENLPRVMCLEKSMTPFGRTMDPMHIWAQNQAKFDFSKCTPVVNFTTENGLMRTEIERKYSRDASEFVHNLNGFNKSTEDIRTALYKHYDFQKVMI